MDKNADNVDRWLRELRANLDDHEIRRWPEEVGDRSEIEVAIVGLTEDGAVRIPDGPGLGITLNEEVVERYRWTGA